MALPLADGSVYSQVLGNSFEGTRTFLLSDEYFPRLDSSSSPVKVHIPLIVLIVNYLFFQVEVSRHLDFVFVIIPV